MSVQTGIVLGYGGGAKIDGQSVLITSGNITKTVVPAFAQPYDVKTNEQRGKIGIAEGVVSFTGNISFDFSVESVNTLITTNFLKRNHMFDIYVSDGRKRVKMKGCVWNSFTLTTSTQSLVTGTLAFDSMNLKNDNKTSWEDIQISIDTEDYIFDQNLLGYWQTGEEGVQGFTLTITQNVQAVHLNSVFKTPAYLRCGAMGVTLQVNAWKDWVKYKTIYVGPKKVTLTRALLESAEFTYNGATETGLHNYSMTAFDLLRSDEELFKIENR